MRTLLLVTSLLAFALAGHSQSLWSDVPASKVLARGGERRIAPQNARMVRLDVATFRARQASIERGALTELGQRGSVLTLPTPDGAMASFRVLEVPVMHPELQARYPMIRTYSGVGITDPSASVKIDFGPNGFHAMVTPGSRRSWFIDPVQVGDVDYYQVYDRRDLVRTQGQPVLSCGVDMVNDVPQAEARTQQWMDAMGTDRVGDCQLRTYRLALACTGEYANFHGSNTTNNNKSFALAAMVTTMNRVNDMFERDATLTMVMVANTDLLIFLNGATDPYTNNDGGTMLGENQTQCDNLIGTANYDIGHVFSTGGGGVAYLSSPCNNNLKAGGVTGQSMPVGDGFDIDYVAHEMGHQYGANHTQNNACNRAASASVEVGSGITIMGYAGICAPDVAAHSIAMFGGYSMQEMAANVTGGTSSSCPTTISLVPEVAPTANAGVDRVIPRSTPFILTGSGSDANGGNVLTYSWEQMDPAVATMPPVATNTGGPAWEPLLPKSTPVRYMPDLSAVIANTTPTWQVLSSVARTYNFRLTVRDNVANGGCNGQDNMVVTVNGASGPFLVTQPNTAVSWAGLSTQTVTWDVANTTASPVSCANVDILLSTDGGLTYPTTIVTATPNDGTQTITVPNIATTTARIMVRANGNIFYDISNTNFTITVPSTPDYTMTVTSNTASVCQPTAATYGIQIGQVLAYNSPVTLSTSGLPGAASVSFSTNPVTPAGTSTLTVSNTAGITPGSYPFTLNAASASGPKSLALTLVVGTQPAAVTLAQPANGATGVAPGSALTWNASALATGYTVHIATNAGMSPLVETATGVVGTSYAPTIADQGMTTYYWTVTADNDCGSSAASSVRSFTTSACLNVTVKVNIDRYGEETTWQLLDDNSAVVTSGGPYLQQPANGTYPQPDVVLCLPVGCYTLVINDSFGDGNCCSYGNGSVSVVDADGLPLTQSPSIFTSTVSIPFCVPAICTSILPYAESFETDFGEWYQAVGDDMDWTWQTGSTPTASTGPTGDHTTGTGHYLYTESSSPNSPSKVADLYGPCIDLSGLTSAELRFWYHLYGATMGSLSVDVWNGSAWSNGVHTLSGNLGNSWQQAVVDLSAFVGGEIRIRFHGTTGTSFTSDMAIDDIQISGVVQPTAVQLSLRAWLGGPYVPADGLMIDSLRVRNMLPLNEPYVALGFPTTGGGGEAISASVLTTTGPNAIVDWVRLELRDASDPQVILLARSALIQRDGDVVDLDGSSPVAFGVAAGSYHVALRHRNHIGAMTASTVALSAATTVIDLRDGSTPTFGTEAQRFTSGLYMLWPGNSIADDQVIYTNVSNDRDPILQAIGGVIPTTVVTGYRQEDLNLDGDVKYANINNDRDLILQSIGGVIPTTIRYEQLP
ncbi:MAG: M12 family metallo-peptidase [Flavobacteriales bacterium]